LSGTQSSTKTTRQPLPGDTERGYPAEVPVGTESKDRRVAPSSNPRLPDAPALRFTDVLVELEAISHMASKAEDATGLAIEAACKRAARLLRQLRAQFLEELLLAPVSTTVPDGLRAS
jgi:hypothetical protein